MKPPLYVRELTQEEQVALKAGVQSGDGFAVRRSGSLTRLGHADSLYIAMSFGVSLMFWGGWLTSQPPTKATKPAPAPILQVSEQLAKQPI